MRLGGYRGSVDFDGSAVTLAKTGRGSVTVPLESVRAVEITRAGVGLRAIRFIVPGAAAKPVRGYLGSTRDVMNDPYSLAFRTKRQGEFEQLKAAVLAALQAV